MISVTKICNSALGKIGASRINNYDDSTESNPSAIQCRNHYEVVRDSLLRSHVWSFAVQRASLSADATTPAFEYDYQFTLPADCLRLLKIYEGENYTELADTYTIESGKILSNDSTCNIVYIKRITDPVKFDAMFVEVLILSLALKLIGPLAGGAPKLQQSIQIELDEIMRRARTVNLQERNLNGRIRSLTYNDMRSSGGALL